MREWLNAADWGDAATWVAAVVSLVALWRAWSAKREAREARVVNERMAGAQERMAEAMERRIGQLETLGHVGANEPAIEWEIEWRGGDTYALRNVGTETATGVRLADEWSGPGRGLPDGVEIGPMRSHRFMIVATLGSGPLPAELLIICDQQPEPQPVRMPAKL